jgi:acetyl-CoA synthetase
MYWIGLQPGDVHLNVASPGWAKHAWSTVFAPWNAAATVLALRSPRPDAQSLLSAMERCRVTTFCAMPTVWRMLAETPLEPWRDRLVLRELVGAGERLDATVIERVRAAWGLQIREGFGQTETTAQIGNPPGQPVRAGSMGRPLPGYDVAVLDPVTGEEVEQGAEGELCLRLAPVDADGTPLGRPLGLMAGYRNDESRTAEAMYDGYYHTRDIVRQDADGYLSHVGRADEVFKAADVRISPFELESVLVAHPAVAEAAVVPSPDPQLRAVPKAFVVLAEGWEPSAETAAIILRHARDNLSVHNRITRLEFAELPKTMAGKVRRVALREVEQARRAEGTDRRGSAEFWAEDLAGL